MKQATDSRSLPAKPALRTSSVGPCASCGGPLTVAGSGVLRHRLNGTVSCQPTLDPVASGWCEPDDWHLGPVAALVPPRVSQGAA